MSNSVAKLYYGNGECSIDGHNIRGVEITYIGNVKVQSTANDSFTLLNRNQRILIFPIEGSSYLTSLFKYYGDIKITSIVVAGDLGEQVICKIIPITEFSEFLNINAEDLTKFPEDHSKNRF